jgi:hypothetical protein
MKKAFLLTLIAIAALGSGTYLIGKRALAPKDNAAKLLGEFASLQESVPETVLPADFPFKENITREFASTLAKELVEKNPYGPNLIDGERSIEGFDPDFIINEFLTDGVSQIDYESFKPEIPANAFRTTGTVTKESALAYAKNFNRATTENSVTIGASGALSIREFASAAEKLQGAIDALARITVPAPFAELHREEMALLTAEKNIFLAFLNMETDPLTALAAFQMLPVVLGELNDLQKGFMETHASLNFN